MITSGSKLFLDYTAHVLKFEGKTSKDAQDTAASCAPFPGAFHTNKGVTYCTFKSLAGDLGISPVTYDRFLTLSDADVAKFIYRFYNSVKGDRFPNNLAIAMTEVAWGSGTARAFKHLRDAVKNLGYYVPGSGYTAQLADLVKTIPEKKLFDQYIIERRKFLDYLTSLPKYDQYKNGWTRRLNDFITQFTPAIGTSSILILIVAAYLILK